MTDQAGDPDSDSVLHECSTLDWTILMRPGSTRRTQPLPAASWKTSINWDILYDLPPAVSASASPTPTSGAAESCSCGGE